MSHGYYLKPPLPSPYPFNFRFIMKELVETEHQYVEQLKQGIDVFVSEVQTSTDLPEPLKGKEKMIFGNIQAIHEFHKK